MTTSAETLRSFVERVERIEQDIKDLNDDKRDIYAEAKSQGFDLPALKAVIARRRKDPDKLTEFEALVETYEAALGTPVATRVHAQERPFEKIKEGLNEALAVVRGEKEPAAVHFRPAPSDDDLGIPDFLRRERVET